MTTEASIDMYVNMDTITKSREPLEPRYQVSGDVFQPTWEKLAEALAMTIHEQQRRTNKGSGHYPSNGTPLSTAEADLTRVCDMYVEEGIIKRTLHLHPTDPVRKNVIAAHSTYITELHKRQTINR
tara:strand:- start:23 stop:400 length:378 start_codon:yes stop_codon:yes gene_type:complete